MRADSALIWGGLGLVAGWSVLPRHVNPGVTFLRRLAASFFIPAAIFMLLPGAKLADLGAAGLLYAMFMAVPVLIGSYAFAGLRTRVGTTPYLVGLCLATVAFVAAFATYLRS